MNDTGPPLLEAVGVSKAFPGVRALDSAFLTLRAGEVVAVIGENGAGKSTLMKILAGVQPPDAGEVRIDGRAVTFHGVADAAAAGVALIHQELNLAGNLTVASNLFLGREPTFGGPLRLLRRGRMSAEAGGLLERVGLPPRLASARVGSLTPGRQQLVEIARALGLAARVLIMDEPTSSLTQGETDTLYGVIESLKAAGVGVLYISHRLAEVERLADRVVILRDGRNAGELGRGQIGHDAMVRLMVGRDLRQLYPPPSGKPLGEPALELHGLRYVGGPPEAIDFEVRAGEVVGMAGLVGAGRTELAEAAFGLRPLLSGEVRVAGRPTPVNEPRDAVAAGVLLVPEDRRECGLLLESSVRENLGLPNLDRLSRAGMVLPGREAALARRQVDRLRVKTDRIDRRVGLLSGGNQQKVVLGRWLARGPKVLILDEPTRGVDVGSRQEIYALIRELAHQGVGVWMISSDLEEVLGMSDRVAVLHQGVLAGVLGREELSEEAVMRLATGGAR